MEQNDKIIISKKPKDPEKKKDVSLEDLAYVLDASPYSSRTKRVFLKTIKYKGDIKRALKEEGYSKSMVNEPNKIIKSKTWESLIDKYFPKDALMKKEKELWKQKDWRAWANSLD